ncbi:MAG: glutamate synthase subunit beta [Planctomycetota bacterium]
MTPTTPQTPPTLDATPPAETTSPLRMRDPIVRLSDDYEVYVSPTPADSRREAERCMNCGAAFCMPEGGYTANDSSPAGCPISNRIPEWNRLVETDRWRDAYLSLAATNNFPEFTSRVCPAPCQDACIVGINERPVGIKSIERAIIDRAFDEGWVQPRTPRRRVDRSVAIVGSGPAGLAAADELNAAGWRVTVYERSRTPGGLLSIGIPNMKLDKAVVARRVELMARAGVDFRVDSAVGGTIDPAKLAAEHDATILATGASAGRDLALPGRDLDGVCMAMDYLDAAASKRSHGYSLPPSLDAAGKRVVVIGGGDTGADCIATALRQGAADVVNITRRQPPPDSRDARHPWPGPPGTYTLDYAHAEGLAIHGREPRAFGVKPLAFHGSGRPRRLARLSIERAHLSGQTDRTHLNVDLAILAIGFEGHDSGGLVKALGLGGVDPERRRARKHIYLAGDMRRGASLVVHAIADGRAAASRALSD